MAPARILARLTASAYMVQFFQPPVCAMTLLARPDTAVISAWPSVFLSVLRRLYPLPMIFPS